MSGPGEGASRGVRSDVPVGTRNDPGVGQPLRSGRDRVVAPVNVTAIIVTRGDHDLGEILDSLPDEWERIIWDNHAGITIYENEGDWRGNGPPQPDNWRDLSVYGRYAAIEYASHGLIYVQDDDCVVSDPQEMVMEWMRTEGANRTTSLYSHVVCNMPSEFRYGFYEEHALVGFGACFHRDAPARAFNQLWDGLQATPRMQEIIAMVPPSYDKAIAMSREPRFWPLMFLRCCDVAFTALTPRVLVDIPKRNLPWAEDESRMYRQPGHQAERGKMLELAFQAKDAISV